MYGVPFEQIDLVGQVVSARRQSGVVIHPRRALRPVLLAGIPVVPLADAIAQTAVASGAVAGICAADDALHRELTTAAQIASAVRALPRTGRTRAGRFLARADLRSESVGETRVRLLLADLGYSVEVQVEIWDAKGFVGRVDLLVEGLLVVEFDGLVKYAGNGGAGVLVAEKQRESRLVSAGYGVLRLVWSDLADPAAVAGEVRRWVARLRRRRVA